MKQFRKLLLMLTCVGVLMSVTACGSDNKDNGAVENSGETGNGATENTGNSYDDNTDVNDESIKNDNMNNATDNTNDKGMIEEAGDKVQDSIDRAEDNLEKVCYNGTYYNYRKGNRRFST